MTGTSLTQALRRNAELFPDKTAIVMGDRRTNWQSMTDRVARFAAGLWQLGAEPGDRIAILSLNSDRYIEAFYASLWAGCVLVPLNTRWSPAELQFAVDDCSPSFLLFDDNFAACAAGLSIDATRLIAMGEGVGTAVCFEALIEENAPVPDKAGADHELAMIFYTGGTTGRPKGVMLSHANLLGNFLALQAVVRFPPDTVYLHLAPMFHLADACCIVGMTLLGATHIVMPMFEPEAAIDKIEAERVTATLIVPTMIAMLVEVSGATGRTIPGIDHILYGASPISEPVLRRALEVFPNARFTQAYGQTEASPVITVLEHEDHAAGLMRAAGRPLPGVDVRIVDDDLHDVPPGGVGEVLARGPNVMLGYWQQPGLTAAAIVDGWLRTGDAGYRDTAGYLFLVDRVKDMIISGGENIYSAEVENALMTHPSVQQCAVIGVPDDRWGEAVHAFVQLRPDAAVTAADLRAHSKKLIAPYKCPKSFTLQFASLPLSGVGKILKTELRQLWLETPR